MCFTSQVRLLGCLCTVLFRQISKTFLFPNFRTDTEITIESVYQALINAKLQPTDNQFDSKDQNTKGMENPPPPPPSQTAGKTNPYLRIIL